MGTEKNAHLKIAVLSGGPSGEHPISLKTGQAAITALQHLGFTIIPVKIEQNGDWAIEDSQPMEPAQGLATLAQCQADAAFIALHGPFGEDGVIQALLDTIGLGYQGSGVRSSAVAMNKSMTKAVLAAADLPVASEVVVTRTCDLLKKAQLAIAQLHLPVFVKPAHLGSSVGAGKAHTKDELVAAIKTGLAVDDSVLIEPLLVGQELTCGVLAASDSGEGIQALPSILIEPVGHDFFDFESKYTPGHNRELCPAPISKELEHELRKLALRSHEALDCRDLSRTDFIVTENGPVILEVNTLPGLTEASLIPKSAREAGIPFEQLIEQLVTFARRRTRRP